MSTVNKSQDWWMAYDDETYIGGGTGGAAYAKTAPVIGDLNSIPFPSGEQVLPWAEYDHVEVRVPGRSAKGAKRFTKGKSFMESPWKHYMQNATFLKKVLKNSTREGLLPYANASDGLGTMVFHWEDGDNFYNIFGVWARKYQLAMKVDDYVFETQTWHYTDVVVVGAALTPAKDFDESSAPLTWADFHMGGYQEVHCSTNGITGLVAATAYYFFVNGIQYKLTGVGSGGTDTFNALISAMNLAYEVKDPAATPTLYTTQHPKNCVWSHNGAAQGSGGYLRCTSATSIVKISAGTAPTGSASDLFATLTDYQHIHTAVTDTLDLLEFNTGLEIGITPKDGKVAGSLMRKFPWIAKITPSLDIKFRTEQTALLDDGTSSTPIYNDIAVWIDFNHDGIMDANEILVFHNMHIPKEGTNINTMPEGANIKEFSVKFEVGENSNYLLI